jgi:glycosyltransferase involved in cell wall biosynthesis
MLISCIIPCFNAEAYITRAVESILLQDQHNLEILIVDDGSRDESLIVAQNLLSANPSKVRLLQHPNGENRGVSASRNLGIAHANGDFICFLDADDFVLPDRFSTALKLMESDSSIDGVHEIAEVRFASTESEKQWFDGDRRFGFTEHVPPDALLRHLIWGRCWATSAILFRRKLLNKTGLFNTQLHIAEDCHLWMRMAAVGRIAQGKTTDPVSVYWRTETSAYRPSSQNRLLYVRALLDFYRWSQRSVSFEKRRTIRHEIQKYLIHTVIALRETNHRLALQTLSTTLLHSPAIMANRVLLRQLASLLISRRGSVKSTHHV